MKDVRKWFLLFLITGPLHMAEQMLTGLDELYELRGQLGYIYNLFPAAAADYVTVTLVILVVVAVQAMVYASISGGRAALIPAGFFGLFGFVESHHIIKTIVRVEYFPGAFTAPLYVIFGFLLFRAVRAEWKRIGSNAAPAHKLAVA